MAKIDQGICVVTHPLRSSGENATRSLLEILSEITSVKLITADLPRNSVIRHQFDFVEISKNITKDRIGKAALQFVINQIRMCHQIFNASEEIILFFGATSYILPILWARVLGKVVIVEPRGDVPLTLQLSWGERYPTLIAICLASIVSVLENLGYRSSNAIITYTPSMARELGLERFHYKLYANGARFVDIDHFTVEHRYSDREHVVGFLGRIDEEKGIRDLAKAVSLLPEKIGFRFIGYGDLYPWLEEELKEEIESGQVELTGWIDHSNIPNELNTIKLLILPSSPTEGLPTSILESLACGTPVLATNVSGIPDVVEESKTGFLIQSTEPVQLARQITDIMDDAPLDQISKNGRTLVEEEFSKDAAVERYKRILSEISARN